MKRTFYTIGSLIILLICAFVFVALPAMVGKGGTNEMPPLGKFDGKEIRYEQDSDFTRLVQQYGQYYQSMGLQIDNSTYFYIFSNAFNSTVAKMYSQDAVTKAGWTPSLDAVNRDMRQYFLDETGSYSPKLYKQTPDSTITKLRNGVEGSLTAQRFNDDNFGGSDVVGTDALYGLKESSKELDFIADYGKEKRGFNVAAFSKSNYPNEEIIAYGKSHSDKFVKYDLSVITLESESEAKKVLKRINAEEISFDDAVQEYSEKLYSDSEGKLNLSYAYQLQNIIVNEDDFAAVRDLPQEKISEPVQTTNGYSIFRKNNMPATPDFDDEGIVAAVGSYINAYETSIIENYFFSQAKDLIADAKLNGFNAACVEAGILYDEIAPFSLNYGSVSVTDTISTAIQGLSSADKDENFLTKAFSLEMNEFSEPIVIGSNIVVLQYTKNEIVDEPTALVDFVSFDQDSASSIIMNSPKLENNFLSVYYDYIMN